MRASFFTFACLALVACSGSSSSDVLGPNGSPSSSSSSSGSTSTDRSDTTPPDEDLPPSTNPPKDDPPPTKPPVTTSPPATAAECDSFAATYCAKADACDALLSKLLSTDCTDRVANICKARLAAPGTGFTSANLTACGNAYGAAATCADAFGAAQIAACSMKGSLALNAKCAFADQCASGFCTGTQDNACGTCATAPAMTSTTYVGLGESCDFGGGGPQCNSNLGLWCDSSTKKCEAMTFVGLGQDCGFIGSDLVMCGPGGTCKWGTGGTGTCLAQKAIGASCTAASGYEECTFGSACIGGTCAYPTAAAICK
jgi:hypothetical protein